MFPLSDMVKELMRNLISSQENQKIATKEDLQVAQNLLDTLSAQIIQHEVNHCNGVLI